MRFISADNPICPSVNGCFEENIIGEITLQNGLSRGKIDEEIEAEIQAVRELSL
jgi:hypothetical protein